MLFLFFLRLAAPFAPTDPPAIVINVIDQGARPDATDAATTTAAFRTAFASARAGRIRVPAGHYLIDNARGFLTAISYSGELQFEPGALLLFTDNRQGGMLFLGGSGARISGFHADYLSPPQQRNSPQEQLKFSDTVDTVLTDTTVEHSPAAGILFYNCVRPRVVRAQVRHSLADGLHFANCQDAAVTGLVTNDTGDDGLAFLNYAQYPDKTGGSARDVHIHNSHTRGITVVGQSHVTVSDFTVENTAASGILCARDRSFNTRVPRDVHFTDGRITDAGALGATTPNRYGIEFNEQADCSFARITVSQAAFNGLSGMAPDGRVTIEDVRIEDVSAGSGFHFFKTHEVRIRASTALRTPSYGFIFHRCDLVEAQGLTAIDTAQTDPLRRAIWFENGGAIMANGLIISPPRAGATARLIGAYQDPGGRQSGEVRQLMTGHQALVPVENNCPRVHFSP